MVNNEESFVFIPDFISAHFFEGFEGEGRGGIGRHDGIHIYDGDVACGDGLVGVLGEDAFGEGGHEGFLTADR